MSVTATPALTLREAEIVLGANTGSSARLAAFIARQALEELVEERCTALDADVPRANMRSRLIILRALDTTEHADAAAVAWNRLSSACHHHAYELSPTVAEARHLCTVVATLLDADRASSHESAGARSRQSAGRM